MKRVVGFFILILALTLFGTGFSEAIGPPQLMIASSTKNWTIMVYLDGDIDIFDIVIAAGHYGQSW